jgi:competence protein ComEA
MSFNTQKTLTWLLFALLCWIGFGMSAQARRGKRYQIKGVININTATPEQLMLLPRIGKGMARRILRYRKRYRFTYKAQIRRIRGIGRKTYRRLAKYITVSKPTKFVIVPKGKSAKK